MLTLLSTQSHRSLNRYSGYKRIDSKAKINDLIKGNQGKKVIAFIDDTLNYDNTNDIKDILKEFENKINDGTLALVVSRSGVKFDSLGFDLINGGPLYIIHGGAEHWNNTLKNFAEDSAYLTDKLSAQWFTVSAKAAKNMADQYKQLIFENAKSIYEKINPKLNESSKCYAVPFAADFNISYLDIRNKTGKNDLIKMALENNVPSITRSGFGFSKTNIDEFSGLIRINPGVNSEENDSLAEAILQFCQ